jgi:hypothetical protein
MEKIQRIAFEFPDNNDGVRGRPREAVMSSEVVSNEVKSHVTLKSDWKSRPRRLGGIGVLSSKKVAALRMRLRLVKNNSHTQLQTRNNVRS